MDVIPPGEAQISLKYPSSPLTETSTILTAKFKLLKRDAYRQILYENEEAIFIAFLDGDHTTVKYLNFFF